MDLEELQPFGIILMTHNQQIPSDCISRGQYGGNNAASILHLQICFLLKNLRYQQRYHKMKK